MKKASSILIFYFMLIAPLVAQPGQWGSQGGNRPAIGRVYGKVFDGYLRHPMGYASVLVLKNIGKKDSIVGGGLSRENGDFDIEKLPFGKLTVKISALGYQTIEKAVLIAPPQQIELDLGNFMLMPDERLLNEVEIKAEKSTVQIGLDKRVFNVDKNIVSAGGTAEDVLRNVPSVQVDMEGNVRLRDNATTIYVDGRPTMMNMQQIPANQIDVVEVISNPSAKFEAATTGGIINIVLKKNRESGYTGFLTLGAGTGKRYNGSGNLNLKTGRWSITTMYNYNSTKNPTKGYSYRTNFRNGLIFNYFNQDTRTTFDNTFQMGRLAADYQINNRNTISASISRNQGAWNIRSEQDYVYLNATQAIDSFGKRTILPDNSHVNYTTQLMWRKTFPKKDQLLTADVNFGWNHNRNNANWETTGFSSTGAILLNFPELTHITGGGLGNQTTFQLDYVHPTSDTSKWEMGVRSFYHPRLIEYFFEEYNYPLQRYQLLPAFSQNNDLIDWNNAAYLTYTNRWKNIDYQLGLRYEQSKLTAIPRDEPRITFGYHFWKPLDALFPSLFLTKKLSPTTELQFNASRKINRPNHFQIIPGIRNNDRENVRIGNPALQPEFIHLAEFNFVKFFGENNQNNWLASVYGRLEDNPILQVARIEPSTGILVFTFENGNLRYRVGLENTLKISPLKNVEWMFNLNVFNVNIQAEEQVIRDWVGVGKTQLNYRFSGKLSALSAQISGNFESDRPILNGYEVANGHADVALKYTFKKLANLTFSLNDIFNSRWRITQTEIAGRLSQENMMRRDLRHIRLTFQMPFGKNDHKFMRRNQRRNTERHSDDNYIDF